MTHYPFLSRFRPLQNDTHVTAKVCSFFELLKKKKLSVFLCTLFLFQMLVINQASSQNSGYPYSSSPSPLRVAMQLFRLPPLSTSMSNSKIMIFSLLLFHASLPCPWEYSQLLFPGAFLFHYVKIFLMIHYEIMLKFIF